MEEGRRIGAMKQISLDSLQPSTIPHRICTQILLKSMGIDLGRIPKLSLLKQMLPQASPMAFKFVAAEALLHILGHYLQE